MYLGTDLEGAVPATCLRDTDLGWMLRRVDPLGLALQQSSKRMSFLQRDRSLLSDVGCVYCHRVPVLSSHTASRLGFGRARALPHSGVPV